MIQRGSMYLHARSAQVECARATDNAGNSIRNKRRDHAPTIEGLGGRVEMLPDSPSGAASPRYT